MRELVKIAKALSDETRIRMLKLLVDKDICVSEMREIFPLSQSQVSRNLKALTDAGFLKRWHEGKCVVYVADRENSNPYCRAILDVMVDSFNDGPVIRQDREALKNVVSCKVREKNR